MPQRIVDDLEAIEVEKEDGEGAAFMSPRARNAELDVIGEESAIGESGQQIMTGVVQ